LIDALLKIHGTDHPFLFAPERRGEVRRSSIDPASAKAVLAWEARVTFEDGLKETYAWYKTTFGR
jgi:UDP-glucose 4-epimerase